MGGRGGGGRRANLFVLHQTTLKTHPEITVMVTWALRKVCLPIYIVLNHPESVIRVLCDLGVGGGGEVGGGRWGGGRIIVWMTSEHVSLLLSADSHYR